jgi:chemotaxis protein CheZ
MPVRRKVFRIEQMGPLGTPSAALTEGMPAQQQQEILAELKAMRELMQRRMPATGESDTDGRAAVRSIAEDSDAIQQALTSTQQAIAALHAAAFCSSGKSRIARELDAMSSSAELAIQRILDAAEGIDEAAKNLAASLPREQQQGLALDIQDQALRIFEACNFQDVQGQRVAKVLATLRFIEARIVQMMEIWGGLAAFSESARASERRERRAGLKGPKVDEDGGHFSQDEIDIMFATG